MGLAIILFIILVCITFVNYLVNDRVYISPSVVFSGVFAFSTFWLILYAEKWNLNLGLNTFSVIVVGNIIFSFVCKIINSFYKKSKKSEEIIEEKLMYEIKIDALKLNVFLTFSVLMLFLTLYFTIRAVNGSFSNIGSALYTYRNLTAYKGESVNMPFIVEMLGGVLHASSYWFMYVLINNYMVNKKINIKILLIILLSALSSTLDGSRGAIINSILANIPLFYLIKNKDNNYKSHLKLKNIMVITILAILLLSSLKWTATLLGRNDINDIDTTDYIAMYVGAEIKNLDTYLNGKTFIETKIGIHTFRTIYEIFSKVANKNWEMDVIPIYRTINGYNLGNVYTIFFDFICDLGYLGILLFTSIMAIVSQILFEKSKTVKPSKNTVPISTIMYSYIFGGIVFAFFGNKFFPQVFSISFIKYVILWYLYNAFFCKLKIKY